MTKIGEGKYGCVYSPPLLCKKNKDQSFYKNKISKATTTFNSVIELEEQAIVDNIVDPKFKYHLPTPKLCVPDLTLRSNVDALDECDAIKNDNNEILPANKISLMMIEKGGLDLKRFVKYFISTSHIGRHPKGISLPNSNSSTYKTYVSNFKSKMKYQNIKKSAVIVEFWKKSAILIEALSDFLKHKTLHHDLKPENIVYDHIKKRFNIIDFGISRRFINYHPNRAHFSYPPETYVLNNEIYDVVSKLSDEEFTNILGVNPYDENAPFMYSYEYFMGYVSPEKMEYSPYYNPDFGFKNQDEILRFFKKNFYKGRTIEEIYQKALMTHDMYGMGLALMYVFIRSYHYLPDNDFIKKLYEVLFSMIHPDCFQRPTVDELKIKYTAVLNLLSSKHLVRKTRKLVSKTGRIHRFSKGIRR